MTTGFYTQTPQGHAVHIRGDREAAYTEWLAFVDDLEPDPRFSYLSCNYKNKDGQTLLTLDQVIQAIVSNDLAAPKAAAL